MKFFSASSPPLNGKPVKSARRAELPMIFALVAAALLGGAAAQDESGLKEYQKKEYPVVSNTGLDPDGFVKASGNKFTINGCDFIFSGFNVWQVVELAANEKVNRGNPKPGREHVANLMNDAVSSGIKVMRAWAHTIREDRPLQPRPGEYDEEVFQGIDWINDEAGKRGLKMIWIFADNWYEVGGVPQYAEWGGGDFYGAEARRLYKNNIKKILTRVNTINGKAYKDDPAIMAWNLANELRCKRCPTSKMQNWIEDMCAYVKSIDGNHMVGIGQEGFHGPGSDLKDSNPADWAEREGQDFVSNHQTWCIDYVGFHVWPDNWDLVSKRFQRDFIKTAVVNNDNKIGKPLILEEFGKQVTENSFDEEDARNDFMRSAYEVVRESVEDGGSLRGAIFYHMYDQGVGPGSYGLWSSMGTFKDIITPEARYMEGKSTC